MQHLTVTHDVTVVNILRYNKYTGDISNLGEIGHYRFGLTLDVRITGVMVNTHLQFALINKTIMTRILMV